jgi:membrane protein DedA with SNARE-associated domain
VPAAAFPLTDSAVLATLAEYPARAELLIVTGAPVEGPVVTVAAAALAGGGLVTWWMVWLAAASADVLADALIFALGRHGDHARVQRLLVRLGLTDQRRGSLTRQVHAHLPRVVIAAKLIDIAAVPTFLAAGLSGVGVRRFLAWVVPATVVRSGVLVGIGLLVGDRFADDLIAHPWLLAVGGFAIALALVIGRGDRRRREQPTRPGRHSRHTAQPQHPLVPRRRRQRRRHHQRGHARARWRER